MWSVTYERWEALRWKKCEIYFTCPYQIKLYRLFKKIKFGAASRHTTVKLWPVPENSGRVITIVLNPTTHCMVSTRPNSEMKPLFLQSFDKQGNENVVRYSFHHLRQRSYQTPHFFVRETKREIWLNVYKLSYCLIVCSCLLL